MRGQVIPYFVASILALCVFWFGLVNLGMLIRERIKMQAAADNSAYTASNMRARGLNFAGALNGFLGMPGFLLPLPGVGLTIGGKSLVWWVEPPHRAFGLHTYSSSASAAKSAIKTITGLQQSILTTYGGGTAFLTARKAAESNGADGIIPLDSFSLRLKRNRGDICYFKTSELFIPATPITPEIWVWPIPYPFDTESNAARWLERKTGEFHKQRMRIIAYKGSKKAEKAGYPFAGKFFGMNAWPGYSCIAAAACYNVKSPMFPAEGDTQMLGAMNEYIKASGHGWDTHLVPAGAGFRH